jgi:hypothetical protein
MKYISAKEYHTNINTLSFHERCQDILQEKIQKSMIEVFQEKLGTDGYWLKG